MTTVINNSTPATDNGSNGLVIGIFVLIVLGLIFFYFGIPTIRRLGPLQTNIPAQVVVPNKIDVNVKQTP
jgi:hypothetical protein